MLKYVLFLFFGNCMFAQTVSTYFSDPSVKITDAIIFDVNGNLYGSDFYGDSVYKVTPDGTVTTFVSGLANPNGLAFDSNGNLFVVEYSGSKIHKYDSNSVLLNSYTVAGTPSGLIKASDNDDMIFTMVNNHSVNRLSTTTGVITELSQGAPLSTPVGLAYDDDGNLYAGNYVGREIYKVNSATPEYVATVPDGGTTSFLAFITYGNGKLWGTIFFNGYTIYEVNPDIVDEVSLFAGSVQGNADGSIATATFDSPSGIIFNASQNALYISEFTNQGNVRKIDGIPLSVKSFSSDIKITLSPNPSENFLELKGNANKVLGETNISIYDTTGKLITAFNQKINNNIFEININVSKLKEGLYFIRLIGNEGYAISKSFIKK